MLLFNQKEFHLGNSPNCQSFNTVNGQNILWIFILLSPPSKALSYLKILKV